MATCLEDILECSVCMTDLVNTQILPCHHSFCKACIDQLIARNKMICPICIANFNKQEVRNDFKTEKLMQLIRPKNMSKSKCEACQNNNITHVCEDCEQGICADCYIAHTRLKVTRNHTVVSLEEKWNKLKPEYDMQLKNLQEAINELDVKLSEHATFESSLLNIEGNALAESQRLRALYIKLVNDKFDNIDDSIRSHSNSKRKDAMVSNKKVKGARTALISQLEKLRQNLEDRDVMLMINIADDFTKNTKLERTKCENLPNVPKIEIKQRFDLNINEALEVDIYDIQSNLRELQLTQQPNFTDINPHLSVYPENIAWQALTKCNCIAVYGEKGTKVEGTSCGRNHELILQQGFDSGTHLFKIRVEMMNSTTAHIGVVSKDQLKLTMPFEWSRWWSSWTNIVYMKLCLNDTRCLEYKTTQHRKFTKFSGKLPDGPLFPMVTMDGEWKEVNIEYVRDQNEIDR